MLSETIDELKAAIQSAHESLRRELAKVRTGRANPDMLDSIRVDYYGSSTPLKQVASISVPEARMIMVKPFDSTQVQAVERAIMTSSLGLNPQSDGKLLRIPLPILTEERRKELVKLARRYGEDCKVSIRHARHEAKDMIDALEKDGDVPADPADRARKELEEIVKNGSQVVDNLVSKREADILEV